METPFCFIQSRWGSPHQYRRQAILERDLTRLKESQEKNIQRIKSVILLLTLLGIILGITLSTGLYFDSLLKSPNNCSSFEFDSINNFRPKCLICKPKHLLENGTCFLQTT